ncbi:MAG TPA: AAA family ATPase [Candidatus Saccharimonadaceae bacterium]|nr:AAA family ATPase [Candidatus Saccharimonadaceae bacterium]
MILLRGGPGCGKTAVATLFAKRYGWTFVEVDATKRERHGTPEISDREDFLGSGRQARSALDAGANVIAEEFFNWEPYVSLFLEPTGLAVKSPNVLTVTLECEVERAVSRKAPSDERLAKVVRRAHDLTAQRYVIPGEITLHTTSENVEEIVNRMVEGLRARGVDLN